MNVTAIEHQLRAYRNPADYNALRPPEGYESHVAYVGELAMSSDNYGLAIVELTAPDGAELIHTVEARQNGSSSTRIAVGDYEHASYFNKHIGPGYEPFDGGYKLPSKTYPGTYITYELGLGSRKGMSPRVSIGGLVLSEVRLDACDTARSSLLVELAENMQADETPEQTYLRLAAERQLAAAWDDAKAEERHREFLGLNKKRRVVAA